MKTELQFHREIYDGASLDAAMQQFEPHGTLSRRESETHFLVTVEHEDPDVCRQIALELGNMALGLTVDRGGVGRAPA